MENTNERVQKITEALYRVTELFPDKEPLKWQLRTSAIELFDFLATKEKEEFFNAGLAFDLAGRISRLLKLAYGASSFISNINFEILRREYINLGDYLKLQIEDKKIVFNLNPASNGHSLIGDDFYNGHKGHLPAGGDNGEQSQQIKQIKQLEQLEQPQEQSQQPIVLKERKRKILSLLGKSEWVSIRDICISLPEFGAKSVQRDLLEMVQAGVLKKEGDKRWRKYGLITSAINS